MQAITTQNKGTDMKNKKQIDALWNELFCLEEVRGACGPEQNAKIETRISKIKSEIQTLENNQ